MKKGAASTHQTKGTLTMNIKQLLDYGANITISVTPMDLKEFAMYILAEAEARAKAEAEANKTDKLLSVKETAQMLGKSINTLWRWEKDGYLVPVSKVGNSPKYSLHQIEQFMKGGKACVGYGKTGSFPKARRTPPALFGVKSK